MIQKPFSPSFSAPSKELNNGCGSSRNVLSTALTVSAFARLSGRIVCYVLIALAGMLQSCSDDDTYADKREREHEQIQGFLVTGAQVKDEESGEWTLNVPGNIRVISEEEFYRNDSTTDVEKNEYVYFGQSGVYMQILDKGTGEKLAEGETCNIITKYIEFNIASDSIQTTNLSIAQAMVPDVMVCSNSYGVFTGTFIQGMMYSTYVSAAVPAGWLVPLSYINLGRLENENSSYAHVRLIVPSTQGQANASANVYPCFYDIIYKRDRSKPVSNGDSSAPARLQD